MNRSLAGPVIHRFSDPLPSDAEQRLGRKGSGLCQLASAGFRVPHGFTLTTGAQSFFSEADHVSDAFQAMLHQEIVHLESITERGWGDVDRPLYLAVRSGAASSMPGMMRSILGVGVLESHLRSVHPSAATQQAMRWLRETFPELRSQSANHDEFEEWPWEAPWPTPWQQLLRAIRLVIASWDSAAAQIYRHRMQIDRSAGTAVNIQVLEYVELAGVLHSRHPVPSMRHWMLAEYASAEAGVVSGRVTPMQLEIPRPHQDTTLIPSVASHPSDAHHTSKFPPSLKDELLRTACCIESDERFYDSGILRHDSQGFDLEWGWHSGELLLFQIRSIISSDRFVSVTPDHPQQDRLLVKSSISESLQHPTPLTWSVVKRLLAGDGPLGHVYRRLGYRPGRATYGGGHLALVGGQIYADIDKMSQFFDCGIPFRYRHDQFLHDDDDLELAPTEFDPGACGPWFLLLLPLSLMRYARATYLASPRVAKVDRERPLALAHLAGWLHQERQALERPSTESTTLQRWHAAARFVIDQLPVTTMSWTLHAGLAARRLQQQLLRELKDTHQAKQVANNLFDQFTDWPVTPILAAQWLQAGLIDREEFVSQFGHRGPNEWELGATTYRDSETLEALMAAVTRTSASSRAGELFLRLKKSARDGWTISASGSFNQMDEWLIQQIPNRKRFLSLRRLRQAAQQAAQLASLRESGRDLWLRAYDILRQWTERLAVACGLHQHAPHDLCFLEWGELDAASLRDTFKLHVAKRRAQWQNEYVSVMPRVLGAKSPAKLRPARDATAANKRWQGDTIVDGIARGRAAIVMSVESVCSMAPSLDSHTPEGTILVCPSLDTSLIPHILSAQGVITEQGGVLSHAAVVARQCGIPVIRLPSACVLLAPGTFVQMDARTGVVETE